MCSEPGYNTQCVTSLSFKNGSTGKNCYIDVQNHIYLTSKKLQPWELNVLQREFTVRNTTARINFSFGDPATSSKPVYATNTLTHLDKKQC